MPTTVAKVGELARRGVESDVPAKAEKREQLLAERWETSETASRRLTEDEELLHELQSKVASATAELRE